MEMELKNGEEMEVVSTQSQNQIAAIGDFCIKCKNATSLAEMRLESSFEAMLLLLLYVAAVDVAAGALATCNANTLPPGSVVFAARALFNCEFCSFARLASFYDALKPN